MLLVQHADHLRPFYFERRTGGNRRSSRQSKPDRSRNRLLSNEVAGGEQCDCGFFTAFETTVSFVRPFCR
jgi:hypothetical protein